MPGHESQSVARFLETGSEIAGAASATAVGLVVAGPFGALAGAAGGPLVTRVLRHAALEFMQRPLGPRQQVKVTGVILMAATELEAKLAGGVQLRQDGFWVSETGNRAPANEVIEGILQSAEREHEERKLKHYAYLVANIAVQPMIDRTYANQLLRAGSRLSYRQLCLLNVFANKGRLGLSDEFIGDLLGLEYDDGPWPHDWREYIDEEMLSLLQELYGLYASSFINYSGHFLLDVTSFRPMEVNVQGAGSRLYDMMELWRIEDEVILSIAQRFKDQ